MKVNLAKYDNTWYNPGGGTLKRMLWYFTNALVFQSPIIPINRLKIWLLRIFGAQVGHGVVIKPSVNIKYPWLLKIGDHTWIGEKVWIDNLARISIGSNVCLSQGALLLTGNHDYKKPSFDLITQEIVLHDGVWVGAGATVCPGVTCHSHSVLTVGSVATVHLEGYGIYQGNPAIKVRERVVRSEE